MLTATLAGYYKHIYWHWLSSDTGLGPMEDATRLTDEQELRIKAEIRRQLGNDRSKTLKDVVRPKGSEWKEGWPGGDPGATESDEKDDDEVLKQLRIVHASDADGGEVAAE